MYSTSNVISSIYRHLYPYQDKLIKEVFGEGIPSAHELEMNKSLMMFSGDGSLIYPHALTPNVVQLGPLHIVNPGLLPDVSQLFSFSIQH